jgi:hypothetical protein
LNKKERFTKLKNIGCIICGHYPEIHHLTGLAYRGKGQKADDVFTIPLCQKHHTSGGHGVAIHAGKQAFEEKYGTQEELLEKTNRLLDIQF